ncbi:MAG: endolytic transglycosylase MltG [Litorivicinaceae bacterium]
MVGPDALGAVAHPEITGDLYFVADGSGGHVFSRTLEAHNANVRKYQLKR